MSKTSNHQIVPGVFISFIKSSVDLRGDVVSVGAINKISFQFPDVPLLTQPEDVKEKMFCDEYSIPPNCTLEICTCVHRIKVKLDSVVELVVYDEALSK